MWPFETHLFAIPVVRSIMSIIECVALPQPKVSVPAMQVLGGIAAASSTHAIELAQLGLLNQLNTTLNSTEKSLRKESCVTLNRCLVSSGADGVQVYFISNHSIKMM